MAVLGESGSGKSTLLSLLAGLDSPNAGTVKVIGENLKAKTQDEMASFRGKNIGIVFQQFHLVPYLTALENISLPLDIIGEGDSKRSREVLSQVGLAERASHFSNQLSGGECQRVAMARAIVARPKLLLADEPSGNLDSETGKMIMDLLFKIINEHEMTAVLVTHSPALAERCQRQVHLKGGRLYA